MGAVVKLHVEDLKVTPGTLASCEVVVRNDGTVVDQLTLDVVGAASSWASVAPPTLSLFPGAEGKATVTFSPPRLASIAPGPVVFGLRAQSHEDPGGSAVEESQLTVLPFSDTGAELIPRTSRGRRGASHEVALDNRGRRSRPAGPHRRAARRTHRRPGNGRVREGSRQSREAVLEGPAEDARLPARGRRRRP
jgi:hypothetical protein